MQNYRGERRKSVIKFKAILIIFFLFYLIAMVLILSSCSPAKEYTKDDIDTSYSKGYKDADKECLNIQKDLAYHIKDLERDIRTKEVLLQTCQDANKDDLLGDEEWMK